MATKGYTIANAQGFFLKHEAETETESEIKAYAAEKIEIIDDFLMGKKRLKANEKDKLEAYLCSLKSTRAIDVYFREFINSHM